MTQSRYTRLQNRLNRVKKVQECYQPHHEQGLSDAEIYRRYIKEQYDISKDTFSQWLGVNVGTEQKKLDKEKLTIKSK
jgi:DNA-binding transcriptional regulator YiaG